MPALTKGSNKLSDNKLLELVFDSHPYSKQLLNNLTLSSTSTSNFVKFSLFDNHIRYPIMWTHRVFAVSKES